MADSKISNLPLSPYVLDQDLIVVVTGHLTQGSYPANAKVPLSYIRKYIVRMNVLTNQVSGINSYYNSGLNLLTTWTTGIHAVPGNNIEVQFNDDTPAANTYGGVGPINYSGIISVTGLNAKTENLIAKDYEYAWPYSGIIYNTGLNAVAGNNIEISYSTESDAHSEYGGAGGKYQSGIVSTTGLNMSGGIGIGYAIDTDWPHKYSITTINRATYKTSSSPSTTISNIQAVADNASYGYDEGGWTTLLSFGFSDLIDSHIDKSIDILITAGVLLDSITFDPPLAGDTQKGYELAGANPSDIINWSNYGDYNYIRNSFKLEIATSGFNNGVLLSSISRNLIQFKNSNITTNPNYKADGIIEQTRHTGIYRIGNIDPMIVQNVHTLNFSDYYNTADPNKIISLVARLSNVQYNRIWDLTGSDPLVTYASNPNASYTSTSATLKGVFIKGEPCV